MRGVVELGQMVITTAAKNVLTPTVVLDALLRHARGEWGEVCDEDRRANDEALVHGARLLSVYRSPEGVKFWIITEWDRSLTTVLLPSDY